VTRMYSHCVLFLRGLLGANLSWEPRPTTAQLCAALPSRQAQNATNRSLARKSIVSPRANWGTEMYHERTIRFRLAVASRRRTARYRVLWWAA